MPALTKPYETFERPGLVVAYRVSNARVWKGALLGLNPSGHVVPIAHGVANLRFVGVANESVDNSAGPAGQRTVNVTKSGSFVLQPQAGFSPGLGDLGREVFAVTDNDVQVATTGLTSQYRVGTIVALEQSSVGVNGVRVRIDNHSV